MALRPAQLTYPLARRADVQAALDALTILSLNDRTQGYAPSLDSTRVRYRREPRRTVEDWQSARRAWRRGHGDCEDLAAWLAADLLLKGIEARAVAVPVSSGFHVVVRSPQGVRDPSEERGMYGQRGRRGRGVSGRPGGIQYVMQVGDYGGTCLARCGGRTFVVRCGDGGNPRLLEVGRRRRLRRVAKRLTRSRLLRGLAGLGLEIAELYPGTRQARQAIRVARGAIIEARRVRDMDPEELAEEAAEEALDRSLDAVRDHAGEADDDGSEEVGASGGHGLVVHPEDVAGDLAAAMSGGPVSDVQASSQAMQDLPPAADTEDEALAALTF